MLNQIGWNATKAIFTCHVQKFLLYSPLLFKTIVSGDFSVAVSVRPTDNYDLITINRFFVKPSGTNNKLKEIVKEC